LKLWYRDASLITGYFYWEWWCKVSWMSLDQNCSRQPRPKPANGGERDDKSLRICMRNSI